MEPVFMVLGQSAATAAVLALEAGTSVQQVPYARLRERLLADKQVLEWTGPKRSGTGLDPRSLKGLVQDDEQAEQRGTWSSSTSVGGFVGSRYLHDGNAQKGELAVTFRLDVPQPGEYEVRLAYTANPNRAANVPVVVRHAGGEAKAAVNQQVPPPNDGMFLLLGRFRFEKEAIVEVSNAGTQGYVIVDAVQLVPAAK
jgi:hypothetical protein